MGINPFFAETTPPVIAQSIGNAPHSSITRRKSSAVTSSKRNERRIPKMKNPRRIAAASAVAFNLSFFIYFTMDIFLMTTFLQGISLG